MRKSELDRLLLTAVAEALGQSVPRQKHQRTAEAKPRRTASVQRRAHVEHHAHA